MRKLAVLLMILILMPGAAFAEAAPENRVHVYFDGFGLNSKEIQSFIKDDRTFIPLSLLETDDRFRVNADADAGTVEIAVDGKTVAMTANEALYRIGEETKEMDVAPFIDDETIYLPLRYIAEALERPVLWDGERHLVAVGKLTTDATFDEDEYMATKDGYSFALPKAYKDRFVIEDASGETRFYDKKAYRRADHVGLVGTLTKVKDPTAVEVPMILLSPLPGGYLIYTPAERGGLSADAAPELKASYEESKEAIKDILKTVKTLDRR